MSEFRETIKAQENELKSAQNADDVLRILSRSRNPNGSESGSGDGFFAGSGDDAWDALDDAGWQVVWMKAAYYWCMKAPDDSMITYVEGDIYRGNPTSQQPA
jgi:hypothetical protein